jgi:hypothetical protein
MWVVFVDALEGGCPFYANIKGILAITEGAVNLSLFLYVRYAKTNHEGRWRYGSTHSLSL